MMKRWPLYILIFCAGVSVLVLCQNLYFNIYSWSLPPGIYRKVDHAPRKGMFAASCLTVPIAQLGLRNEYLMKGRCRTGIQPVMKKIYGVPGDTVEIIGDRIFINGEEAKGIHILDYDSKGRDIYRFFEGKMTLNEGYYLLLSDYKKNSWDSRYWGAVNIDFVLEPVFIFPFKGIHYGST